MVSIVVSLLWAMLVFCWMANPLLMLGLLRMECANHFIKCLKDAHLYPFPTLEKVVDVSSNKPKFSCFDSKIDFSFYNLI